MRDLHDGAQQRLVHTVITMKLTRDALRKDPATAPSLLDEALEHCERAVAELRELSHGIMPAVLTHGGLRAGVEALAARMPVPVEIDVDVGRLGPDAEATAYFIVAEALTNIAKHARARRAARHGAPRGRRRSRCRCATTGWAAPAPAVPVCSGSSTGWRSSTGGSGSRARPAVGHWSPL